MNSKSNTQAMETEKIPRLLAQLAIPAVVAQIINLLYNIVDRIYIGHISGVGAAALTGVGLFTPILMLINAFAMLAGSGGAPRAAISMGKKDNKTAEKILGRALEKNETEAIFYFVNLNKKNEDENLKLKLKKLLEQKENEIEKINQNFDKKIKDVENNFLKNLVKKSLKVLKIKDDIEEEKEDEETGVHKNYYEKLYEEQNKTIFDR